jgi:uncharacterized protein YkwD
MTNTRRVGPALTVIATLALSGWAAAQGNGASLDALGPTFNADLNRVAARPRQAEPVKLTTTEKAILDGINAERKKEGLPPLRPVASLMRAARKHTERMVRQNFFDHEDPDGKNVAERVTAEGYRWSTVGENIAMNGGYRDATTAGRVAVTGWMKSPGHRRNILNAAFTETGVGVVQKGDSYHYTQVFGRPQG